MKLRDLLKSLKSSRKLRVHCPSCEASIFLNRASLFTADALTEGAIEFKKEQHEKINELKNELLELKKKRLERAQRGTRSSNLGKILEKFVPILPGFSLHPEECVPLLDPIDYVAFNGLVKNRIESLTFMDVKSGRGQLGPQQKSILRAVEAGKIELDLIKRGKR